MLKKTIDRYRNLPVHIKSSIWYLICSFLQKGISMLTTPIFTRILTTAEYGKISVFTSWLGIVTIFVSLNLSSGVYSRGVVTFEKERAKFSSSMQGLSLVLCLTWTFIYIVSRDFWNQLFSLTTLQMIAMLVMIWTSAAFNFWAAEQRVIYKYRNLVIITLIVSVAKPSLGIILVLSSDDKVTARILGMAIVELLAYSWTFIQQMVKGKVFYSQRFWKHALVFNIPLIPHYLSQTVLNSSDRIMIEKMVGSDVAGIYSLAYSLGMIMMLINTAISQTLNPWLYTKIRDRQIKSIAPIAYSTLILVAGSNLILIAFAPEAVKLFAPKEYYDAIWCIPPIALSVYFSFCYDLFAKVEFYYEKTKLIALATVSGAALNIILNVICIKKFGYVAAAYTTLICYIAYAAFHYLAMKKISRIEFKGEQIYNLKRLLQITITFLAIGLLYLASYKNLLVRYGITAVLAVFIFIRRKEIFKMVSNVLLLRKKEDS